MSIARHGINRIDSGALRKCSFEETVEILLRLLAMLKKTLWLELQKILSWVSWLLVELDLSHFRLIQK